jgi:hypothetical protein
VSWKKIKNSLNDKCKSYRKKKDGDASEKNKLTIN